jgi:prepilin signal peptidase PulO-like enzyme (type II secretory pathway)
MGKVWASALVFVAVAPLLAALASWAAERTAASYAGAVTRTDKPAGSNAQLALAIGLALAAAWMAIAAWGAGPRAWAGFLLAIAFIYSGLVDAKTRLLPHAPTALAAIVGLALAWLAGGWQGAGVAVAAGLAAGGTLWLVGALFRNFAQREAIGLGDMLLVAAGGILLGPAVIWTALAAAAAGTAALVVALRRAGRAVSEEIPFGPGLLAAIWIAWAASAIRI